MRQRWLCKNCNKSFHWKITVNKINKEKIWFERWVVEGYSVRQLCNQSGYSNSKIHRIINYWLNHSPNIDNDNIHNIKHVTFDGTFLHRPNSIVVLMNAQTNTLLHGKFGIRENSEPQLRSFFQPIKDGGFNPKSFTLDGNPQVIRTVRNMWPGIIVQRCLVHVQRQGLMWCRRFPKRTEAKHLRELFKRITYINTHRERDRFISDLKTWEQRYGCHLVSKPERGKVFSDIKRARSMLIKALPDMFHYLNDSNISKTTNGLEGYFSRLKQNYRNHRGLKPEKRANYFKWFFVLKSK